MSVESPGNIDTSAENEEANENELLQKNVELSEKLKNAAQPFTPGGETLSEANKTVEQKMPAKGEGVPEDDLISEIKDFLNITGEDFDKDKIRGELRYLSGKYSKKNKGNKENFEKVNAFLDRITTLADKKNAVDTVYDALVESSRKPAKVSGAAVAENSIEGLEPEVKEQHDLNVSGIQEDLQKEALAKPEKGVLEKMVDELNVLDEKIEKDESQKNITHLSPVLKDRKERLLEQIQEKIEEGLGGKENLRREVKSRTKEKIETAEGKRVKFFGVKEAREKLRPKVEKEVKEKRRKDAEKKFFENLPLAEKKKYCKDYNKDQSLDEQDVDWKGFREHCLNPAVEKFTRDPEDNFTKTLSYIEEIPERVVNFFRKAFGGKSTMGPVAEEPISKSDRDAFDEAVMKGYEMDKVEKNSATKKAALMGAWGGGLAGAGLGLASLTPLGWVALVPTIPFGVYKMVSWARKPEVKIPKEDGNDYKDRSGDNFEGFREDLAKESSKQLEKEVEKTLDAKIQKGRKKFAVTRKEVTKEMINEAVREEQEEEKKKVQERQEAERLANVEKIKIKDFKDLFEKLGKKAKMKYGGKEFSGKELVAMVKTIVGNLNHRSGNIEGLKALIDSEVSVLPEERKVRYVVRKLLLRGIKKAERKPRKPTKDLGPSDEAEDVIIEGQPESQEQIKAKIQNAKSVGELGEILFNQRNNKNILTKDYTKHELEEDISLIGQLKEELKTNGFKDTGKIYLIVDNLANKDVKNKAAELCGVDIREPVGLAEEDEDDVKATKEPEENPEALKNQISGAQNFKELYAILKEHDGKPEIKAINDLRSSCDDQIRNGVSKEKVLAKASSFTFEYHNTEVQEELKKKVLDLIEEDLDEFLKTKEGLSAQAGKKEGAANTTDSESSEGLKAKSLEDESKAEETTITNTENEFKKTEVKSEPENLKNKEKPERFSSTKILRMLGLENKGGISWKDIDEALNSYSSDDENNKKYIKDFEDFIFNNTPEVSDNPEEGLQKSIEKFFEIKTEKQKGDISFLQEVENTAEQLVDEAKQVKRDEGEKKKGKKRKK